MNQATCHNDRYRNYSRKATKAEYILYTYKNLNWVVDLAIKQLTKTPKYVWEQTESPQDRIMRWVLDLHFKKRKGKENLKNANKAAEISFTIVLCEEYEHAICGTGVMV